MNLTSFEYRKRDAEADKTCPRSTKIEYDSNFENCRYSVLLRISKTESTKRHDKSQKLCSNLDNDAGLICLKKILVLGQ